jgi:geranylgeranyl pyrophosphate synthase
MMTNWSLIFVDVVDSSLHRRGAIRGSIQNGPMGTVGWR